MLAGKRVTDESGERGLRPAIRESSNEERPETGVTRLGEMGLSIELSRGLPKVMDGLEREVAEKDSLMGGSPLLVANYSLSWAVP